MTWKDIPGYEGLYQASTDGRVKSLPKKHKRGRWKGCIRIPQKGLNGYLQIGLVKNKIKKTKSIHRLVLETHIGPCPDGMECRHLDGNRHNNHLNNLEWATKKENMSDKPKHGTDMRGTKHHKAKLCELDIWLIRNCNVPQTWIADFLGISQAHVSRIKLNQSWNHLQEI